MQRIEMRRAFYAGAASLFAVLYESADTDGDERGVALLEAIAGELDEYARELRREAEEWSRNRR
jgi:hypothetical protein